jgi:hypothetical protein
MNRKKTILSGPSVSREVGKAEICSDCGYVRIRLSPWVSRARRSPVAAKCEQCGMVRFLLVREMRPEEVGRMPKGWRPGPRLQDVLLKAAKERPSIRLPFARVLLTAQFGDLSKPVPVISDRDLVTALRVTHGLFTDESRKYHIAILQLLLREPWDRGWLGLPDVRRCQRVLREAERFWGTRTEEFRRELDEIGQAWERSPMRNQRGRAGRPFNERGQRILVAVHFLKVCGEKRAEELVADVLATVSSKELDADSIRRMLARRRARFRTREAFLESCDGQLDAWLLYLSRYLMQYAP